jgi:hypothetical protein
VMKLCRVAVGGWSSPCHMAADDIRPI